LGLFAENAPVAPVLLEHLKTPGSRESDGGQHDAGGKKAAFPSERQKKHILAILKKTGECGETELAEFRDMHPGVRELRTRNYLSSLWTQGEWKTQLGNLIKSGKRLPSGFERADLIAEEMEAARAQIGTVCFSLELPEASEKERFEALIASGELAPSQAAFFPEATLEALQELKRSLENMKAGELRHCWRRNAPNMVSAISAAHKLRFTYAPFSEDEYSLLCKVFQTDVLERANTSLYTRAFTNDTSLYGGILPGVVFHSGNHPEPLLEAAKSSSEFDTLLDFLGITREHTTATIARDPGFTKAKEQAGKPDKHPENEDALTSFKIMIMGGKEIRSITLDVVFDGVSGQGGASMASRMAKDAFEIAALAGWIRSPEDVRLAAMLADLAININKEQLGHMDMGTTMTASYIEGNRFFGIHCGDSDWKVIRGDSVMTTSVPHGQGRVIWAGLGIGPRDIHINNENAGFTPVFLEDGDFVLTQTDGIGDVVCDHEYCILAANDPPDALRTQDAIVQLADSRKDPSGEYEKLCGCEPAGGKDDDMTIIARLIKLGS
jgi:serine/threonine protein phosphatase PrpC